jgi:hypothetical protein
LAFEGSIPNEQLAGNVQFVNRALRLFHRYLSLGHSRARKMRPYDPRKAEMVDAARVALSEYALQSIQAGPLLV